VCELTERVLAIVLLACCQAVELRDPSSRRARTQEVLGAVRALVPMNTEDRRQDVDIAAVLAALPTGRLRLGGWEEP
jgi:histidine ammonia-lyase